MLLEARVFIKLGRSKDEHVHGGTGESIEDKAKHALGLGDKH